MIILENTLAAVLPLDGAWDFRLGEQAGTIHVPGAWQAQGYARRVEGPGVYSRTVRVPAEWQGQRVQLQFDAVSYYAEVAVNGQPVGSHTGAWSAFALDVTDALRPGADNVIELAVWNIGPRFPLRESLVGFLPDVALMFAGIWQPARLVAFPGAALSDVVALAEASGRVRVRAQAHGADGAEAVIRILSPEGQAVAIWRGAAEALDAELAVASPVPWRPDSPARYTVEIALERDGEVVAQTQRRIGFRSLASAGKQLLLNGDPACLRGVLNWGWYPDILCPAPSDEAIRDEFRRVRTLGFNLVKLCLYVPSARYFEIADEEGMLLWLELPLWLPEVTDSLRAHAPVEYADLMAQIHHHPSVVIYSLGCELDRTVDAAWIAMLDEVVRDRAAGVLVCDNSGSGEAYGYLGDLADFDDYHFYADLEFFYPLLDHFRRDWRRARPLIFGEFCDADDFRDLSELEAAWGELPWWTREQNPIHPLSKLAYSQQRELMQQLDLGFTPQELVTLSRRQSFMIRKTILEKTRARSGIGGYVITSIRETPLSTSSLFDDLGRSKYDPAEFRRFNADTVLLLGRARARRWLRGGDRPAPFEPYNFAAGGRVALYVVVAHASGEPISRARLAWRVRAADGATVAEGGDMLRGPLTGGDPQAIGRIVFDAPPVEQAATLTLDVTLDWPQGKASNYWPLWIFPAVAAWPEGVGVYDPAGALDWLDDLAERRVALPSPDSAVLITSALDDDVLGYLRAGGSVLLAQQGAGPLPAIEQPFWREAIRLPHAHPALDAMPHDGMIGLQFYGLATDWALRRDALAALPDATDIRPLLTRLDARIFERSEYLLAARIGRGKLIATTLRFGGGLGDEPLGLRDNLAGRWLLLNLLKSLAPSEDK